MDIVDTAAKAPSSLKHQLAKLVLATAAGFIATKLAEKAYDSVVESRTDSTTDN